jgi:hypothetical protein
LNKFHIKFVIGSCVIAGLGISANSQPSVGLVLEVQGSWYLSGSKTPLKRRDRVPASGVIRVQSPQTGNRITIIDISNGENILDSRECPSRDCSKPIKLPPPPQKPGIIDVMWNRFLS